MSKTVRATTSVLLSLCGLAWCAEAFAYRPFDGTDAAVAEPGEVEIELGPVQYLQLGSTRTLVAPAVVLNYGLAPNWEAVLQGEVAHGLSEDVQGTSLIGAGVFLKGVLREGSLQGMSGPSIATEFGFLLPDVNGGPGTTGGSIAGIVSQRWSWMTIHLNAAAAITRQQNADVFLSMIVEGPHDWPVRPVAEIFYERDFGGVTTTSALVGAIWQVRDHLSIDVGLRRARINDDTLNEVRAGLTFSFSI
jgi:hypothetical protein